ncbi:hypothetical protein B0H15DRAFT_241660 [Mycena belliarum]|uniref:Uncharacterized protein n=1 Tax=Mycena belliarum TaxID=1033014 RepID=A0AAD6U8S8_9AGAR|nr:hypothetical protein B0H15DRAFT_241660 [Mycena belliae]
MAALDHVPPELCSLICGFACTDSGYTGRSLSLVSRYIRTISQPFKLQSIALCGRQQILGFAALLTVTPARLCRTRYLYLDELDPGEEAREAWLSFDSLLPESSDDGIFQAQVDQIERQEGENLKILDDFGTEGARLVESILRDISLTLEVLDVALNEYVAEKMLATIFLPRLTDLTTRSGFPLSPAGADTDGPHLAPCATLRRLHIVEADPWAWSMRFFENGISQFAPALTHLRISETILDDDFLECLAGGLGLCTPLPDGVTLLPATLELLLVEPGFPNGEISLDDRQVLDQDRRVIFQPPEEYLPEHDVFLQEWLDKAGGAPCHWDRIRVGDVRAGLIA